MPFQNPAAVLVQDATQATATLDDPADVGSLLVAKFEIRGNSYALGATPNDWTKTVDTLDGDVHVVWLEKTAAGGETSVTLTIGTLNNNNALCHLMEIPGGGALDVQNITAKLNNVSGESLSAGTAAPTNVDVIVVASLGLRSGSTGHAITPGYQPLKSGQTAAGNKNIFGGFTYKIVTADPPQAIAADWSWTGGQVRGIATTRVYAYTPPASGFNAPAVLGADQGTGVASKTLTFSRASTDQATLLLVAELVQTGSAVDFQALAGWTPVFNRDNGVNSPRVAAWVRTGAPISDVTVDLTVAANVQLACYELTHPSGKRIAVDEVIHAAAFTTSPASGSTPQKLPAAEEQWVGVVGHRNSTSTQSGFAAAWNALHLNRSTATGTAADDGILSVHYQSHASEDGLASISCSLGATARNWVAAAITFRLADSLLIEIQDAIGVDDTPTDQRITQVVDLIDQVGLTDTIEVTVPGIGGGTLAVEPTLTPDQIHTLVTAARLSRVELTFGLELYDAAEQLLQDITGDLVEDGSQIASASGDRIHRTCRLRLSRELQWAAQRVKPYVTVTDGETTWVQPLGMYVLDTPDTATGETPTVWTVEGRDKLALLDVQHGTSVTLESGGAVLALAEQLIDEGAGGPVALDPIAAAAVAPEPRTWPLDPNTRTLDIVNDLLAMVGYEPLWCDRHGGFRSGPQPVVASQGAAWQWSADSDVATVGDQRISSDVDAIPNRWVFWRDDGGVPTDGLSRYEVLNRFDGPTSLEARGGRTVSAVIEIDAVDHPTLVAEGDRIVAEAKRGARRRITFPILPDPRVWHHDVVGFTSAHAGIVGRIRVVGWTLPFVGDMTVDAEVI